MDEFFLDAKRGYYATLRFAWEKLARFKVTPARLDLLRCIAFRRNVSQSWLRQLLGVARSTLSRMMLALVRLGLVKRERDEQDRRTFECVLTDEGNALVDAVVAELVESGVVPKAIDHALAPHSGPTRRAACRRRRDGRELFRRLMRAFASMFAIGNACFEERRFVFRARRRI